MTKESDAGDAWQCLVSVDHWCLLMLLMLLLTLPGQSGCGLGSAGVCVWVAPSVMFTAQAQVINTVYVAANKLRGYIA